MLIEKYSIGIGDRFGSQGEAQLKALVLAATEGVNIVPVWNKSRREHTLIGSLPVNARIEADNAVKALGWNNGFYVDADHIGIKTVQDFIPHCNFFTLDVADFIGLAPQPADVAAFIASAEPYTGTLSVPGISESFTVTKEKLALIAAKYLTAIKEAGSIYKYIVAQKGADTFVTEVSFDENLEPQSPEELFFILLGLANEGIPVQTFAPKFSGRFNKGVDYVGDIAVFEKEFSDDVAVTLFAIEKFGLPASLKLSVHSGSDKFSLYPVINKVIRKFNAGLHLKTAGTTWLEEAIGLAQSGDKGAKIVKDIYRAAFARIDEMMQPYLTVVDIDVTKLPVPDDFDTWPSSAIVNALAHEQSNPAFSIHLRQLMHLAYKIAAEMGSRYTDALVENRETIGSGVTNNLFIRHIQPLFIAK
ncbi:MAG: hypothetical protein HY965_08900 [Ignavibacteriales bacterium]|nr:hypothetical protein [Ignavibacteriales bacterium]